MSENVHLMNQEAFESYLANKYGEASYGLKIARVESGRVKATLRLKAELLEPTPAPVVAAEPVVLDLHALGSRWQAGEKISVLARGTGRSWNKLHSELTKLGYGPQKIAC